MFIFNDLLTCLSSRIYIFTFWKLLVYFSWLGPDWILDALVIIPSPAHLMDLGPWEASVATSVDQTPSLGVFLGCQK